MIRLAKHISLFLFVLFVFPQINNALHFYIIDHVYHKYDSGENIYPNYKNHDCQVSTFKIPKILLFDFEYTFRKIQILYHEKQENNIIGFYENLFLKNNFNKGPPMVV